MERLENQQIDHRLTGGHFRRHTDERIGIISFRSLVELLDEGVVVVRRDGAVKYINPAALRVFGLETKEATAFSKHTVALRWYDADGTPLSLNQLPLIQTFRTGMPFSRQVLGTDLPTGERRWMLASARLIRPEAPTESDVLVSFSDITEEHARMERLVHQANHDPLTGLPNRAFVLQRITEALGSAGRDRLHAVLFVDLDDLKITNDTLGHEAGDELLNAAARQLRHAVGSAGVVARLGGDEFVLLIFGDGAYFDGLVGRLHRVLAEPVAVADTQMPIRASVGVVQVGVDDARSAEEILRDADRAMYEAKRAGRVDRAG